MTRRLAVALLFLPAFACTSRPAPPAEPPRESADARPAPRELKVAPEMQKKWGLATGPVARLTVTGGLTLPGVIALNQQRTAQITSLLEGSVTSIAADLGDQVRRGQVLLVLHSPALAQAQTAFLQAAARRNIARRELERARELMKDEAIQQKEVQRRQAEFEAATTEYGAGRIAAPLARVGPPAARRPGRRRPRQSSADLSDLVDPTLRIRAPIDGRVLTRDVVTGEHVHPDKLLFTVSDLSTLWALLDAREQDLPGLSVGGRVQIATEVYGDRRFAGRSRRVGDVVDEKLRTIKVRVELPNPGLLLKPNMFVQGSLEARGRHARGARGVPRTPSRRSTASRPCSW